MSSEPVPPTGYPLRIAFQDELDQLRLQVELMGVRVDQNLERMRERRCATAATSASWPRRSSADDEIDAMHVSLLERCYSLLNREAPMAVRPAVPRVGRADPLRVRADRRPGARGSQARARRSRTCEATGAAWDLVLTLVDVAVEQYRPAAAGLVRAGPRRWPPSWPTNRPLVRQLSTSASSSSCARSHGPEAVPLAMAIYVAGQAADRIADHAAIIGARLRYLITGDPEHLAPPRCGDRSTGRHGRSVDEGPRHQRRRRRVARAARPGGRWSTPGTTSWSAAPDRRA